MKVSLFLSAFFVFLFNNLALHGQLDSLSLMGIGNGYGDSIKVRWVPPTYDAWQHGMEAGYSLSRMVVSRDGVPLSMQDRLRTSVLLATGLKPLPKEDWLPLAEQSDMALLAAGTAYDGGFEMSPESLEKRTFNSLKEYTYTKDFKFAINLFAADHSFSAACGLGLGFLDTTTRSNEGYLYTVTFSAPMRGAYVQPAMILLEGNKPRRLGTPGPVTTFFMDQLVSLSWDDERINQQYVSYLVEKSSDGENFSIVNTAPVVNYVQGENDNTVIYFDSLADNSNEYFYRIKGLTPFGDVGPPSEVVSGKGVPAPVPVIPQIVETYEFPKGIMQVRWTMEESMNNRVRGFNLYRSTNQFGEYQKINDNLLPSDYRVWADTSPPAVAYYVVEVIDENGRSISNFPYMSQLQDNTPPLPPRGLSCGWLDTTGNTVVVEWNPNEESDLKGYRVFFANDSADYFVQWTNYTQPDTFFVHKVDMNPLQTELYVKVLAVDRRENFSYFSEPCRISRPDKNPPTRAVFKSVRVLEKGIFLKWGNSSSSDLIVNELQRMSDSSEWIVIHNDSTFGSIGSFMDTTIGYPGTYQYRIRSVDARGWEVFSEIMERKAKNPGVTNPVNSLTAEGKEGPYIELNWGKERMDQVYFISIFRAEGDQPLRLYDKLYAEFLEGNGSTGDESRATHARYVDHSVDNGKTYRYKIQVRWKNSRISALSQEVRVSL